MAFWLDEENKEIVAEEVSSSTNEETQVEAEQEAQSQAVETQEVAASPKAKAEKEHFAKNETEFKNKKQQAKPRPKQEKRASEFEDKIIDIARVTTVVKGGRRFSFSAVVAIGNRKGKVGFLMQLKKHLKMLKTI